MAGLIDTHAHLDEIEDIEDALGRARQSGLEAVIAVGQDLSSNSKILDLSRRYPGFILPALGLHPWAIGNLTEAQMGKNLDFIKANIGSACAIGEVGLDYDKRVLKGADKERQKAVLRELLKIAVGNNKPVSLHSRYAWKDCLQIVTELAVSVVVFHWYTGFSSTLAELIRSGYYISATPAAEYHEEHRRAVKEAPVDRLLLETDCPVEYGRGQRYRSQPADVVRSLKACAGIKGMDETELGRATTANAREAFGLP